MTRERRTPDEWSWRPVEVADWPRDDDTTERLAAICAEYPENDRRRRLATLLLQRRGYVVRRDGRCDPDVDLALAERASDDDNEEADL